MTNMTAMHRALGLVQLGAAGGLLFSFTDEVIVRVKATHGRALVDVRSRSRLGRIDRGVNARRIRSFLDTLQQRAAPAKR